MVKKKYFFRLQSVIFLQLHLHYIYFVIGNSNIFNDEGVIVPIALHSYSILC